MTAGPGLNFVDNRRGPSDEVRVHYWSYSCTGSSLDIAYRAFSSYLCIT
jgi:hypothetical protein